jgi:SAM-dependent methyltransferase
MHYKNLTDAIKAKLNGLNVSSYMRNEMGLDFNSPAIIEIAYDLQAGDYVKNAVSKLEAYKEYVTEIGSYIRSYIEPNSSILDAGCGEMTITAEVLNNLSEYNLNCFATDISLSRLMVGRSFIKEFYDNTCNITPFVASFFSLPIASNSFDLVFTTHAIEPNGGFEREALNELFRVSRSTVLLFEPSYENNSEEGRRRMESLGYIKGLPDAIGEVGGEIIDILPISAAPGFLQSPLNPTYVYICKKLTVQSECNNSDNLSIWTCPGGEFPLTKMDDCYFSSDTLLAFPIIRGIPILRNESGVLASALLQG